MKVSRALECLGLRKGDVVAVILPNCLEYPILIQVGESFPFNMIKLELQGCLYLGLTVTPINPAYTATEISRQLQSSSARIIFSHGSVSAKTAAVRLQLSEETTIISIGEQTNPSDAQFIQWEDFLALSSSQYPEEAEIDIKRDVALEEALAHAPAHLQLCTCSGGGHSSWEKLTHYHGRITLKKPSHSSSHLLR